MCQDRSFNQHFYIITLMVTNLQTCLYDSPEQWIKITFEITHPFICLLYCSKHDSR